jgi:hypothetical protein
MEKIKQITIETFLGEAWTNVKGQDAVNKLYLEKRGHVPNAFYRQDIGDITLVWGNSEKGLCHIVERREQQGIDIEDFLSNLSDVIEKGVPHKNKYSFSRIDIWHSGKMVTIETTFDGIAFNWVLTGFIQRKEPANR